MNDFDLSKAKKIITPAQKRKLIIIAIFYFGLSAFISSLNRNRVFVNFFGFTLSPSTVSGMMGGIIIALSVIMTQIHFYYGFIVSIALMSIYTALISLSVFKGHNTDALPGISFMIAGYLINTILYLNLKKVAAGMLLNSKYAITDPLTGIYNRRGLTQYLDELIAEEKAFYVLFIDLDNFKKINDTAGHSSGDYILNIMAGRWKAVPKPDGIMARNGGDEYVIVIPAEDGFNIETFAGQCVEKAREEVYIAEKDERFNTSASIGVAAFPENGSTADEILANADIAMYESKKAGKDRFTVFKK